MSNEREIKFRAWDISKRKILRNVGFHPHICMIHEGYKTGDDAELTIAPDFTNYKIMQYTGLEDERGVAIYGGDIVNIRIPPEKTWSIREIVWSDAYLTWMAKQWLANGRDWLSNDLAGPRQIEVIGNIYENPELLHGAAK